MNLINKIINLLKRLIVSFRINGFKLTLLFATNFILSFVRNYIDQLSKVNNQNYFYKNIEDTNFFKRNIQKTKYTNKGVLIITDTQLKQCILNRVYQKTYILNMLGIKSTVISPQNYRLSFILNLYSHIIVYRTVIDDVLSQQIQSSRAKVFYEIDDLVIGKNAIQKYQLKGLSTNELNVLTEEYWELTITFNRFKNIIVPNSSMSHLLKKEFPNKTFTHIMNYAQPNKIIKFIHKNKAYDFAFTTASTSIDSELLYLEDFLSTIKNHKNIKFLITGADKGYKYLKEKFPTINFYFKAFQSFDGYIQLLSKTKFTLIPIENTAFNQCKSASRLYDALISGSIPIYSDVGDNRLFNKYKCFSNFCIRDNKWANFDNSWINSTNLKNISIQQQKILKEFFSYKSAALIYKNVFQQ